MSFLPFQKSSFDFVFFAPERACDSGVYSFLSGDFGQVFRKCVRAGCECARAQSVLTFPTYCLLYDLIQIMFHIEKAHYIVDEMVANGSIVETNKANILKPLQLMDKLASEESIFSRNR